MLVELFIAKTIADAFVSKKKTHTHEVQKKDKHLEMLERKADDKRRQALLDEELIRLKAKSKGLL